MKKWAFAFFLIPLFTHAELLPFRCSKIFDKNFSKLVDSAWELQDEIKDLKFSRVRDRNKLEVKMPQLLQQAIQILDSQGIGWHYSNKAKTIIRITPDEHGSTLNKLAAGLEKNLGGAKLEFDPKEFNLIRSVAYLGQQHKIVIDIEFLSRGYLTPSIFHEIRHAYNEYRFLKKNIDEWNGSIVFDSKKKQFNDLYEDTIYLDELVTYASEIHQVTMAWEHNPDLLYTSDYNEIMTSIKYGRSLSGWLARVMKSQAKTLEGKQNVVNDDKFAFFVIADQGKVAAQNMKSTMIQIHQGKFITYLNFSALKNTKTREGWIQESLKRLQFTSTKAERLRKLYDDLEQAVKDLDPVLANAIAAEMKTISKEIMPE